MTAIFPTAEWLKEFENKLNADEKYGQIARNWEGDIYFIIQAEGNLKEDTLMYFDLYHGKCRSTEMVTDLSNHPPAFILKAGYKNFSKILTGELDPMQAMLTRKLDVKGNMVVMMRNVPTVLDFVRCAREITQKIL
jgi:putative sterol carrier protein